MNRIFFHNVDKKSNIKNSFAIKTLLIQLFNKENTALEKLDYIFCSEGYLLKINQQHLNHDTHTDIITFKWSKKSKPVMGEIYISIDRVKENAKAYEVLYQNELLRVMIHGALHLCGYNDKTKIMKSKMSSKEDFYLNFYQFHVKQNFE